MKRPNTILALVVATAGMLIAGCDNNPTNEPSVEEIRKADEAREAAIDNNPNMTPEQREEMKKHLSFGRNRENETRGQTGN